MELQFTRRDFFKGSIVVALGVAGAGVLRVCSITNRFSSPLQTPISYQ